MTMIGLGQTVRDKISGFTGVATGRAEFLYGCERILVQPKLDKDGKPQEADWFDEPQLDTVPDIAAIGGGYRDVGGPIPSKPTRNKGPSR